MRGEREREMDVHKCQERVVVCACRGPRSCSLGSCGSWVIHWLRWEATKSHGDHTEPTELLCLLPPLRQISHAKYILSRRRQGAHIYLYIYSRCEVACTSRRKQLWTGAPQCRSKWHAHLHHSLCFSSLHSC